MDVPAPGATVRRRPGIGDVQTGDNRRGQKASPARQGAVRPAEDGGGRGRLRRETGRGSVPAGLAGVDAGDRAGGAAGPEHRAADGRDGDVRRSGR